MAPRRVETLYAYVTLAFVAVFAPIETVVSWEDGLASPFYLVDAIAIGLLLVGALRSLRARPRSAPAVVTVGWAWAGANFWRAALARSEHLRGGGALEFGSLEMQLAIAATGLALVGVCVGTWLIVRVSEG